MKTKVHINPFLRKNLFLSLLIFSVTADAQFVVSAESSCPSNLFSSGDTVYEYIFSRSALSPDFDVKVSSFSFQPDFTMKIVDDPSDADLIFVDEEIGKKFADMLVCKRSYSLDSKLTEIKVSRSSLSPDIEIVLTRSTLSYDYKIFIQSEYFSDEEAAALFPVIWESNRSR